MQPSPSAGAKRSRKPAAGGLQEAKQPAATVQPSEKEEKAVAGCTLAAYAENKQLPVEFLSEAGLTEIRYLGSPAVRIPYRNMDGAETAVRFRVGLLKATGDRFKWRKADKPTLYGLERLGRAVSAGYAVLVEGESDAHTLWYHDEPGIGIPGAGNWREEWAPLLASIPRLYLVVEPDRGGEAVLEWLRLSQIRSRVHLVRLDCKDPSELHCSDPDRFQERWKAALASARPWTEIETAEVEAERAAAWDACQEIATAHDILTEFGRTIARRVAGEPDTLKILFLTMVSRLLARPVSVAVKGPSSGGKSFTTERVLDFFPTSAYYSLSAMSDRALAYSSEPLSHRMLVVFEATGVQSEMQSYLLRSLLSEGRIRYEFVEKTRDGMRPRLIEREGPTGLLVTTTAASLHPENETRMLTLTVADTREQTELIMLAQASRFDGSAPVPFDAGPWHALQTWLERAEHRVVIPFARCLAKEIAPVAVRLRRDIGTLLSLIQAHAILHQATRGRDGEGRILATLADYAAVRRLVAKLIAEGVEAAIPPTVATTVNTLATLHATLQRPVTVAELAKELALDKSAMLRRVQVAIRLGYLKNEETERGRPAKLTKGDDLPAEIELLPDPEKLLGCTVAALSEGYTPLPPLLTDTQEGDEEDETDPFADEWTPGEDDLEDLE